MIKETILITGAGGQLGSEIKAIALSFTQYHFLFVTKEELPIDDHDAVKIFFNSQAIHYCINCAAYTAVDKAETEKEKAFSINAEAVGNLAMVCREHHTSFIHISTDYVFDGKASFPYKEDDIVNPVNFYGASKLQGEVLAMQNNPLTIVIRTSWVYAVTGNNFVKTMLRLMKERDTINVVSDQQGCPTYAADLAVAIMQIILQLQPVLNSPEDKLQPSGIFNYCNTGVTTWYQFALAIKELSGSTCIVNPIASIQYPTPAKRPQYSLMDTTKIQQTFNLTIPQWRESLKNCVEMLTGTTGTI